MKPAPLDYLAPTTVEAALEHLAQAGGEATVLAGGQTLMPLLSLRMSTAAVLVDINRIAALKGVARADDGVRIGAVVRQNEGLRDGIVAGGLPVLVEAVRHIGHHQTRNRGTVG